MNASERPNGPTGHKMLYGGQRCLILDLSPLSDSQRNLTIMPENNLPAYPLARTKDLVTEIIGSETVVYDGLSKDAHCLAPLAAVVFAAADGHTSVAGIAVAATEKLGEPVEVADVERALAELEDRDLVVAPDSGGVSRRDLMRKGALVGGAALAAPLIVSLATPSYGQASSLSSLSYVVMVWKDAGGTYYRVKVGGDGLVVCGWGFATPGSNCTFAQPANTSDDCIAGLSVNETTNGSGDTLITINWTDATKQLQDVRIKCANDCHIVNNPTATSPSGPYVGCP
jgi:hypothetical protein